MKDGIARQCRFGVVLFVVAMSLQGQNTKADCHDEVLRGPYETFPSANARNVPLNARVRVRYGGNSLPQDPIEAAALFRMVNCGPCGSRCTLDTGTPVTFDTTVEAQEATLVPTSLAAGTQYLGEARGLENNLSFVFCTTALGNTDTRAPVIGNVENIQTTLFAESCEHPMGGYRVGFQIDSVSDEDLSSVELKFYVTRADGLTDRRLVNTTRVDVANNISLGFEVDQSFGNDPACFDIEAIDGVGNRSGINGICYDPYQGVQFKPLCSLVSAPRARGNGDLKWGFLLTCFATMVVALGRHPRR